LGTGIQSGAGVVVTPQCHGDVDMSEYQSRIREIQSAFVMQFQDRETCITMFENLLHEYGLLRMEEQLDRTITNENFLALLKMAKEHRAALPMSEIEKHLNLDDLKQAQENMRKFAQWMEKMARGADQRYRIADSVNRRCPVCQQPTTALFNRVQSHDHETIGVDPPRCQPCMLKWIEERFGKPASTAITKREPVVTEDGSPVSPLRADELNFFSEYEKQMQEPQP
jgi:hypothetical protein